MLWFFILLVLFLFFFFQLYLSAQWLEPLGSWYEKDANRGSCVSPRGPAHSEYPQRRKHKVNQQKKTKKRKKFRSFSSSLAEPTTVCNRRSLGGEKPGSRRQPARSSLHTAPAPCYCCCLSSRKGAIACTPSLPLVHRAVPLQLRRWAEGRPDLSSPQGAAGTRESEEGHCSVVEVIESLGLHCCWAT